MSKIFIKELNLISFGKFQNKSIKLNPNFNLIYGDNESGKSTISDFIEGVFYGFDDGNNKRHFCYKKEKYKPLGSYKYFGNLILSSNNEDFRIERNFDDGSYKIYNLSLKKEIMGKKSNLNFPGEYFLKLNYSLYKSIANNYQLQSFDKDSKKVVIDFLKNPTNDIIFSQLKAIENINDKLNKIGSSRAYTKPYAKTLKELENKNEKLDNIRNLRKSYNNDIKNLKKQREEIKLLEEKLKKSKIDRDNYRKFKANSNYIEEKSRKDQLKIIDKKLEEYKEFSGIDKVFFDNLDKLLEKQDDFYKNKEDYKINLFYFFIGFMILFVSIFTKKYFILLLLLPLFLFYFFKGKILNINSREGISNLNIKIKNEFAKISVNSKSSYKNAKNKYKDYEKLIIERDKTLEILKILQKQEKYDVPIDFSCDEIDILKLENKIKFYENSYYKLLDDNLKLEKKLVSVEEKISKEVDLIDEINQLKEKLNNLEIEISACNKAIDIISSNKDKFIYNKKILSQFISQIIREISKGKYKKIDFDKNLEPIIISSDNEIIDIDKVSIGFFDQVNFSLRFALCEKLLDNLFLIFDDAFINYDNDRLRMALLNLLDLSKKFQIIYFTCHKREKDILDAEAINIDIKNMEQV